MKITRALLLSSQKQAESWERTPNGHVFMFSLFKTEYRYLVTKGEEGSLRFQIFCVSQHKNEDGSTRNVVAEHSHLDEFFGDMGKLINFLRRYQIDFETAWQPVEVSSDNPQT